MRLTLPLLACNSCAGWVGGAGNLIAVPADNSQHMKYQLWRQLFPVGRNILLYITLYLNSTKTDKDKLSNALVGLMKELGVKCSD